MHTAGPRPAHSLSVVQTPQLFEAEQTGLASGQSLLPTHSTQAPLVIEQTGFVGVRVMQLWDAGADMHPTHAPALEQNGAVAEPQSVLARHATQAPLAPQNGVPAFRPAQVDGGEAWSHGTQVFCGPQKGVVPWQSLSVSQATQAPLAAQTGFDPSRALHALASAQPTHTFLLQKDFSAVLQSPSPRHSTH